MKKEQLSQLDKYVLVAFENSELLSGLEKEQTKDQKLAAQHRYERTSFEKRLATANAHYFYWTSMGEQPGSCCNWRKEFEPLSK